MIDLEKIKALPEDKPRKGPHRMGKSEKCEARRRYKVGLRNRRRSEHLRRVKELNSFWQEAILGLGVPPKVLTSPTQNNFSTTDAQIQQFRRFIYGYVHDNSTRG